MENQQETKQTNVKSRLQGHFGSSDGLAESPKNSNGALEILVL